MYRRGHTGAAVSVVGLHSRRVCPWAVVALVDGHLHIHALHSCLELGEVLVSQGVDMDGGAQGGHNDTKSDTGSIALVRHN